MRFLQALRARFVLLSTWAFTVLGDVYVPVSNPTPPASNTKYGYYRYCTSNDQCATNECCKPFSGAYYACAPIGYDPRECLPSPTPSYWCSKDTDCPGGCCYKDPYQYSWGSCRYDSQSCKKDGGSPTTCLSSRECGPGGCCAYNPYYRNYYCVATSRAASSKAVKRAIIFPQTKYPAYQPQPQTKYPVYPLPAPSKYPPYPTPPPSPTKYPPYQPYPVQTKYPPYPPYPTPPTPYPPYPPYPAQTKYPPYPVYPTPPVPYPPYPAPTKYPPYLPPPPPPPPIIYPPPPPPPIVYPPVTKYPPYPPPTKYPSYPPPTKYPTYPTSPPTFCLP